MNRENFYKLLTRVLTALEHENYICIVTNNKLVNYRDINFALVTFSTNYTVTNNKDDNVFNEDVCTSRYYDFKYYKGTIEEFSTEIISMDEIKNVLLQNIMKFPYLSFLYNILLDKYNEIKDKTYTKDGNIIYINLIPKLVLSDDEIDNIINLLSFYNKEEKEIKTRLRKKEF